MSKKRIEISSSFMVAGGEVTEVGWTPEDAVLLATGHDRADEEAFMDARYTLRAMARSGSILYRRNPEHGWWEYGPQWRAKGFRVQLDAEQAAVRIVTTGES